MNRKGIYWRGAVVGGLTSLGLIGIYSLGNQLANLPFVPFDVFDWLTRVLPGRLVIFAIDTMVKVISGLHLGPTASTAKLVEQGIAFVQFIVLGIVFGLVMAAFATRNPARADNAGLVIGAALSLFAILVEMFLGFQSAGITVTAIWVVVLMVGWGWLLSRWVAIENLPPVEADQPADPSRREFFVWMGSGSLILAVAALGFHRLETAAPPVPVTAADGAGAPTPTPTPLANTSGPAASPPQDVLTKRIQPAPGTRVELTPTDQFYRIDINADVPTTDMQAWRLKLDGLVNQPLSLTVDDLRKFPSVSQVVTMECISNDVGGDLTSTGDWTGVPFKTVLEKAGLKPDAAWFNIESFDGFYESVPLQEAMDGRTMLVYDMNGAPLLPEHGFPLRIYIPNHFGMKQPKWITHIEASKNQGGGYWVQRGWSKDAIIQTTSVIDAVSVNSQDPQNKTIAAGGIAFGGARGISKVEVQMDSGPWMEAKLRVPALSPLSWVQWRYDFPYQAGHHIFKVQAYDGGGQLQVTDDNPTFPNGATGIFSLSADL